MTEETPYAVLSGDLIKSSRLSTEELETVRQTLRDAVDSAKKWKRGLVKGSLSFFRGDSWQLLLTDPALALRVAVFIRARLIAGGLADSRIAAGVGKVKSLSPRNITQSTGEAFTLSGETLDAMKDPARLAFAIGKSQGRETRLVPLVASLCDALISEWTQQQATVVALAVHPDAPTQEAIARALDPSVSQVAVSKSLTAAHWSALRQAIKELEQCL